MHCHFLCRYAHWSDALPEVMQLTTNNNRDIAQTNFKACLDMLVKAGVLFRVTDSKYLILTDLSTKCLPYSAHVGEPTICAQLIVLTHLLSGLFYLYGGTIPAEPH